MLETENRSETSENPGLKLNGQLGKGNPASPKLNGSVAMTANLTSMQDANAKHNNTNGTVYGTLNTPIENSPDAEVEQEKYASSIPVISVIKSTDSEVHNETDTDNVNQEKLASDAHIISEIKTDQPTPSPSRTSDTIATCSNGTMVTKKSAKKKTIWEKIALIFQPWKWRRKKRSKKMEDKVNELERRLSVRKSREELVKRGLIQENHGDDHRQQPVITKDDQDGHLSNLQSSNLSDEMSVQNGMAGDGHHVSFSSNNVAEIPSELSSVSPRLRHQIDLAQSKLTDTDQITGNGSAYVDDYPPPPDYNEPPPYAPPRPPPDIYDDSSSDDEHTTASIPLVKEVPIREPDLNAVPKKSAMKKTVNTRPVVIVRTPQKPSTPSGGDSGSYCEDSSDEEIHYRDDPNDENSLAAKVARNDSLARFLENRPEQKDLEQRNILHTDAEDEIAAARKEMAVKLGRKLSMRPTAEDLERRNILHDKTDDQRRKDEIECIKSTLNRKLSIRPTIEDLKQKNILQFSEYVEVTEAEDYDRRADKPWTRLTPKDKAAIRKELNEFKEKEMPVHDESRHLTRFHKP